MKTSLNYDTKVKFKFKILLLFLFFFFQFNAGKAAGTTKFIHALQSLTPLLATKYKNIPIKKSLVILLGSLMMVVEISKNVPIP